MRASCVVSVLAVLLCSAGTIGQAKAQGTTLGTGNCAATVAAVFSPGLSVTQRSQSMSIDSVFTGCAFVNAAKGIVSIVTPYKFTWSGSINGAGCVAILENTQPAGTGTLYWENGQTSTVQFDSLSYTDLTGIVPAEMIFGVTAGYQQGASFSVNAALIPTAYGVLQCAGSLLNPNLAVNVITGAVPTIVFENINVSL
ncbi:hypothetical protein EO087_04075 [Dyella sp. M7H15-1]|uniref:hypothetical protein n=1 Tax=Dyella sp. M7H15-1 TaxID=2501295 RepID=UPI001004F9EC|nr:hypothetical protein [Dyella sp. M7H15-1]QAU23265.1 hypothetical protein EO087_04075 [Dyella sp. M7H15-1]